MRHIFAPLFGAASCFLLAGAALAQKPFEHREPGLWELRLVGGSGPASAALSLQRMLENMPEAQRRQMEQMMGGSKLSLPVVVQQCLTPEVARSDAKSLLAKEDVACSDLQWQESGGSGQFSFACSTPQGDWSGQGRIWDATAKRVMSEASVQGSYRGQPLAFDMTHEARWLGPDCQGAAPAR